MKKQRWFYIFDPWQGYTPREFVPSRRMSSILTEVSVALATSDVQSTVEILATDEIHMEDQNHGLAWTKPNNGIYKMQNSQQTCALTATFE